MPSIADKLATIQAPRSGAKSPNSVLFADHAEALPVAEFLERYKGSLDVATATPEQICNIIEPGDVFVSVETIKNHQTAERKPYLINGMRVVKEFIYDDFKQFRDRVVLQQGYAQHFNIMMLARPNLESIVTPKKQKA